MCKIIEGQFNKCFKVLTHCCYVVIGAVMITSDNTYELKILAAKLKSSQKGCYYYLMDHLLEECSRFMYFHFYGFNKSLLWSYFFVMIKL